MKYALKVRYIGKNYYGSQIQFENGVEIDKPTIQGILEKADPVRIIILSSVVHLAGGIFLSAIIVNGLIVQ